MFRLGLLIIAVGAVFKALDFLSTDVITIIGWTGFGITLAGFLVTATHPSSIRVEVVNDG